MSIGQQFSDFRKTTPRYVQWVLLFAALLVVVVLLILLRGSKKTPKIVVGNGPLPINPELIVTPNRPIDWANTFVGEERTEEIRISANRRVQITGVTVHVDGDSNDASGISAEDTCTNDQTIISPDMACVINITFRPMNAMQTTGMNVSINWNVIDEGEPLAMDTQNAITAIIGAREKPAPKPESDPTSEPVDNGFVTDDAFYYDDDFDYNGGTTFGDDLNTIAPPMDFVEPEPVYNNERNDIRRVGFGNACSDFAFPAYNTAGIQSGWIKPEGGAYYYHPFSDTNCDTPAGIYNPETGYIMDVSNPARKIGSDSEHIRLSITERMPVLTGGSSRRSVVKAEQLSDADMEKLELFKPASPPPDKISKENEKLNRVVKKSEIAPKTYLGSGEKNGVFSSRPYDRTFVLRQYKPIPATIVSDIQADAKLLEGGLPVRATVDRNVYSDNGRTVIIPTGTLMLGYVTGDLPGPYKAVGRMEIKWYQFIRPDGVEFNFKDGNQPFAADSQGRKGVPGHGNTDYLQQFVMPMLTAIVPAAVNLIAPISDAFVNQIDLDNNTVVQTGTVRSSELAKNEIITAWNNVATKLLVDMMDNTTPPFSIAAGTRITVFSPVDLFVTCGQDIEGDTRKCAFKPYPDDNRADWKSDAIETNRNTEELIGQVRSMLAENIKDKWCEKSKDGTSWYAKTGKNDIDEMNKQGYSFTTIDFYCRSFGTYDATNNAKQAAVYENQQQQMAQKTIDTQTYNQQVLGLEYNADGTIKNPFNNNTPKTTSTPAASTSVVTCDGGANPDANGCCPGETYTDMGDQGFNCCPDAGGDCFPPIQL